MENMYYSLAGRSKDRPKDIGKQMMNIS